MSNNKSSNTFESLGGCAIMVFYILVSVLPIIGYVKGIVKLCRCDFEPSYKAEVIYGIGTVTGLNCILGFFNFGEFDKDDKAYVPKFEKK